MIEHEWLFYCAVRHILFTDLIHAYYWGENEREPVLIELKLEARVGTPSIGLTPPPCSRYYIALHSVYFFSAKNLLNQSSSALSTKEKATLLSILFTVLPKKFYLSL